MIIRAALTVGIGQEQMAARYGVNVRTMERWVAQHHRTTTAAQAARVA
jgi:hypothetical protein